MFYFLIISLVTSLVADVVFEQVKSKELVYVDKARETPLYALGGLTYLRSLRVLWWEGIYIVPDILPFQLIKQDITLIQ